MKHIFLVLILLGLSACQSLSRKSLRIPASDRPRHIIFTLHGIGGTDNTFGHLQEVIEPQLEAADPGFDVITRKFVYPTGSETGDLFLFSEQLGEFIEDTFKDNPVLPMDKISFVVHSQGGLITTIWYVDAISQADHPQHQIAKAVKGIVTESTPFWGSKAAYFAYDWGKYIGLKKLFQKYLRMSPAELRDMSFGSNNVLKFFQTGTQIMTNPLFAESRPRMLNISGIVPDINSHYMKSLMKKNGLEMGDKMTEFVKKQLYQSFNAGIRWESDSAVNPSSARIDFNYALGLEDYRANDVISFDQFNRSQFFEEVPFVVLETVHASLMPEEFMDIAWVPPSCADAKSCEHPTYKYIFKHLAHCERENSTCNQEVFKTTLTDLFGIDPTFGQGPSDYLASQLRCFGFTINVRLPKGYKVTGQILNNDDVDEYVEMDFARHQSRARNIGDMDRDGLIKSSRNQKWEIRIGRRAEAFSRTVQFFPKENQLRFFFTGNVMPKDVVGAFSDYEATSKKGFPLKVRVTLPGLKPRVIEAPLQPSYTTFVDIKMDAR